jgi:photosystem II stability/assembly factor-like uncharacterized protein
MRRVAVLSILAFAASALAAPPQWTLQPAPSSERLRGVSAVDEHVAWASGNKATVLRTLDGGRSWQARFGPTTEALDFRDVEAIDANVAYVLSIGPGEQSRIYKTVDGGTTWVTSFRNAEPRGFYDAIAFWNSEAGLALGDPVDGRFEILRTTDGGRHWMPAPSASGGMPPALPNEGAFAASGTCLVVQGTRRAWFATGGAARARVFRSADGGLTWQASDTPLAAGSSSAGAFSLAFADDGLHGIVVGGDYRNEGASSDNIAVTADGGVTWSPGPVRLRGFRSAVAFVPGSHGRALLTVGPAGSDWSADGGATWTAVGDDGFHALSIARGGKAAWAVGERGRIARSATLPR